jgi:hypothetical protein
MPIKKNNNLSLEIVIVMEAGFDRELNKSIFYSPLRLFYNAFKKKNPNSIEQVRKMLREDIEQCLNGIENFDQSFFIKSGELSDDGKQLMKKCYNIGIKLLKKDLSVKVAFRALRNSDFQQQIYHHILKRVQICTIQILDQKLLESQNTK